MATDSSGTGILVRDPVGTSDEGKALLYFASALQALVDQRRTESKGMLGGVRLALMWLDHRRNLAPELVAEIWRRDQPRKLGRLNLLDAARLEPEDWQALLLPKADPRVTARLNQLRQEIAGADPGAQESPARSRPLSPRQGATRSGLATPTRGGPA